MYLDNVGDMIFKNHKTNETAVITLIEKGWNNKVIIIDKIRELLK